MLQTDYLIEENEVAFVLGGWLGAFGSLPLDAPHLPPSDGNFPH